MKGLRFCLIFASTAPCLASAWTCVAETCNGSSDDVYMDNMLASMNADELAVHLLQRKVTQDGGAQSTATCKGSCASSHRPWKKKCKKSKCAGCPECSLQSGKYALYGDGECRGSIPGDTNSWYADKGRYPLHFKAYQVGGQSLGFPYPWKADEEKVFYYQPSSRLETEAFPTINSKCAEVCDSFSFCKGYQITMRGCEYVKPGKTVKSNVNCEYAYNGCYCWKQAECYLVTDFATYKNSEYAADAGVNMAWGATKTFQTALGAVKAQTYCHQCTDVKVGGKKTRSYPRSGYFCFMKNNDAAALLEEDDSVDHADDADTDADHLTWPTSAAVTKMCQNGTLLPPSPEVTDSCF